MFPRAGAPHWNTLRGFGLRFRPSQWLAALDNISPSERERERAPASLSFFFYVALSFLRLLLLLLLFLQFFFHCGVSWTSEQPPLVDGDESTVSAFCVLLEPHLSVLSFSLSLSLSFFLSFFFCGTISYRLLLFFFGIQSHHLSA